MSYATASSILDAVCAEFDVARGIIPTYYKARTIASARSAAVYLMRARAGIKVDTVRHLVQRSSDHIKVMVADAKLRIATDAVFAARVEKLAAKIAVADATANDAVKAAPPVKVRLAAKAKDRVAVPGYAPAEAASPSDVIKRLRRKGWSLSSLARRYPHIPEQEIAELIGIARGI